MWVYPSNLHRGEGPHSYGKQTPMCTDCSGCNNRKFGTQATNKPVVGDKQQQQQQQQQQPYMEFLAVEFSRDVEAQSPAMSLTTTQETVAFYLSHKLDPPSSHVCVVNAGLHDMSLKGKTAPRYADHVRRYLQLLEPQCHIVIWIACSATKGNPPQTLERIQEWNAAAQDMIARDMPQVVYVDIWHKSLRTEHEDNVHLDAAAYYIPFANMFYKLMIMSHTPFLRTDGL
jgi:hypothetical protein